MTREEVFNKVAKIISNHFEIDTDKVSDELNIKDDLKADSISIMEFVLELEDEFGTEISDEDAEQIETVGGAVDKKLYATFYPSFFNLSDTEKTFF